MKDVQCHELFGGIALKNHTFSFEREISLDKLFDIEFNINRMVTGVILSLQELIQYLRVFEREISPDKLLDIEFNINRMVTGVILSIQELIQYLRVFEREISLDKLLGIEFNINRMVTACSKILIEWQREEVIMIFCTDVKTRQL